MFWHDRSDISLLLANQWEIASIKSFNSMHLFAKPSRRQRCHAGIVIRSSAVAYLEKKGSSPLICHGAAPRALGPQR